MADQIKEMPPSMRLVFAILLLLVSLFFILKVADVAVSEIFISGNKMEANASISAKSTTHNKYGYKYYIGYVFNIDGTEYHRTQFFNLLNKKSEIAKNEYDQYQTGDNIIIYYAAGRPIYNRPVNIINLYKYFQYYIIGILVFTAIGINEIRNLIRKKRS